MNQAALQFGSWHSSGIPFCRSKTECWTAPTLGASFCFAERGCLSAPFPLSLLPSHPPLPPPQSPSSEALDMAPGRVAGLLTLRISVVEKEVMVVAGAGRKVTGPVGRWRAGWISVAVVAKEGAGAGFLLPPQHKLEKQTASGFIHLGASGGVWWPIINPTKENFTLEGFQILQSRCLKCYVWDMYGMGNHLLLFISGENICS